MMRAGGFGLAQGGGAALGAAEGDCGPSLWMSAVSRNARRWLNEISHIIARPVTRVWLSGTGFAPAASNLAK